MVQQQYEAEILTEYVIRGNHALLRCSLPSFVADFVRVESWILDDSPPLLAGVAGSSGSARSCHM